jgi:hypothetical protein
MKALAGIAIAGLFVWIGYEFYLSYAPKAVPYRNPATTPSIGTPASIVTNADALVAINA